jgi:uncharacterized protein Usg
VCQKVINISKEGLMILTHRVKVDIFYYIPQTLILQEFLWELDDVVPEMPRVHKFLNFWKDNIDARIAEVLVCHSNTSEWRKVDWML